MPACCQVVTTTATREEAAALADAVVARRLAACAQVAGPVESRYWWHDRVETATEWVCLAKTTTDRADALVAAIAEAHSYDEPEILVTRVDGGSAGYLRWIAAVVGGGDAGP